MKTILSGALTALTLAGALSATALPAAAEEHRGDRGGWHDGGGRDGGWRGERRDWRGGWGAGPDAALLGLSVGAALAGGAYYAPGYADYPPAYYAAVPRCRIEVRWNPYWRGYERVRVCY